MVSASGISSLFWSSWFLKMISSASETFIRHLVRVWFAEVYLVYASARVVMLNYFSHLSSLIQFDIQVDIWVDHEQFLLIKVLFVNIFDFSLSFGCVDFTTIWRLIIIINEATPLSHLDQAVPMVTTSIGTVPLVETATAIITRWLTRLNVPHRILGVVSLKIFHKKFKIYSQD